MRLADREVAALAVTFGEVEAEEAEAGLGAGATIAENAILTSDRTAVIAIATKEAGNEIVTATGIEKGTGGIATTGTSERDDLQFEHDLLRRRRVNFGNATAMGL